MKDCKGAEIIKGQKIKSDPGNEVNKYDWPVNEVLSVGDDTVSIRQVDNPDCFSLLNADYINRDKWTIIG